MQPLIRDGAPVQILRPEDARSALQDAERLRLAGESPERRASWLRSHRHRLLGVLADDELTVLDDHGRPVDMLECGDVVGARVMDHVAIVDATVAALERHDVRP